MFAEGVWPALPDIEAARASYDIISWAIEPGDIVIFHPGMLHGGAPTRSGQRRRTISLRFFGDQAYCAERPETGLAEIDRLKHNQPDRHPIEQLARQPPGSLFRHPAFHKVA
jgi:ectoine hydroxylase-related dioxygenase (phytanoyl-CoA dioxygenase family)